MKMFKKNKHKRSAWFEGLLYAESLPKHAEIFVEHTDGLQTYDILYRNRTHETPWAIKCDVSIEFGEGVLDYLSHKRKLECSKN